MKNILITLPADERHKALFEKQAPEAAFAYVPKAALTEDLVRQAHVIIGNVPPAMLKYADNLEWLQLGSAGANDYVKEGVLPPHVVLTNATGAYGLALSEYMLGTVLELMKNLHRYRDNQQNRLWKDEGTVTSIYGSTTLVIGLGDICNAFASSMKKLGSYLRAVKRLQTEKPDYIDELYTSESLEELLPRADIVAVCVPGNDSTFHMLDSNRLNMMKPGAILVNVGRGSTVDTNALAQVLERGHLRGAALDVTDPEPLPSDHRLWELKNCVITPHTAGAYHLPETLERIVRICASNLWAYINNKPLRNIVDLNTGYRRI